MEKIDEWCPTAEGKTSGFEPEYLEDEKWKPVPTTILKYPQQAGIPQPQYEGGIISSIGLFGHAQAQALAWCYAAEHAAAGRTIEVRVAHYEIVYSIKAKRITT